MAILKAIRNGLHYITALLCMISLCAMPLAAEDYSNYYSNDCYEYQDQECCQSNKGSYVRDAVVIGIAAALGAVAGAIAGNNKGKRGSDGEDGANGSTGNQGPVGATGPAGGFVATTGPEQLTFTFHTGVQTTAAGLLRGVVTLPDLTFQTIELPFNTSDNSESIVIGPPAEEGDYTITIHIHTLNGSLNTAPSVIVQNSLNSEQSSYTAALPQSQGQQTNFTFVYDTFLLP